VQKLKETEAEVKPQLKIISLTQ